jgi:hypothetical protein
MRKLIVLTVIVLFIYKSKAQSFKSVYYHDTNVYVGYVGKGNQRLKVKTNIYKGNNGELSEVDFHVSNGVHLAYRAQSDCSQKDSNDIMCATVLDDNNDFKTFRVIRIDGVIYIAILNPLTNDADLSVGNCKRIK